MSLEQQEFDEEKTEHAATLEHWNIENLMHGRDGLLRSQQSHGQNGHIDERSRLASAARH
jgi:hypothetical protein